MESPSDLELVHRTLRGEEGAFDLLVRRYEAGVLAIAYAKLLDEEGSRDVAQETFFRAFMNLARLRSPDRFGAWVSRIADAQAQEYLRRVLRERPMNPHDFLNDKPDPDDSVQQRESREETTRFVATVLARLDETFRVPLVLRFMGGLSYAEIAERLSISPDAAFDGRWSRFAKTLPGSVWKTRASTRFVGIV